MSSCSPYIEKNSKKYVSFGTTPTYSTCSSFSNDVAFDYVTHCCYVHRKDWKFVAPYDLQISYPSYVLLFAILGIFSSYLIVRAFR